MDVSVLLQTGTGREGLAALCASVTPSTHVMRSDMALQIRRVREDLPDIRLLAIF